MNALLPEITQNFNPTQNLLNAHKLSAMRNQNMLSQQRVDMWKGRLGIEKEKNELYKAGMEQKAKEYQVKTYQMIDDFLEGGIKDGSLPQRVDLLKKEKFLPEDFHVKKYDPLDNIIDVEVGGQTIKYDTNKGKVITAPKPQTYKPETREQMLADEEAKKKIANKYKEEKESLESKRKRQELDKLKKRHDSKSKEINSIERGVGEWKDMFGGKAENRNRMIAERKDQLRVIEGLIKSKGGDLRTLGITSIEETPDEESVIEPERGLPVGITEEDIDYNMKKYGKSREEVIQKFLEMKENAS